MAVISCMHMARPSKIVFMFAKKIGLDIPQMVTGTKILPKLHELDVE